MPSGYINHKESQDKLRAGTIDCSSCFLLHARKMAEKADDLQPAVRGAAFRMAEKASGLKEDMATYMEKLKEKRNRDEAEDWDDFDLDELEADEAAAVVAEMAAEGLVSEEAAEEPEMISAEGEEVEMITPEMNKYLNKVEDVLDEMGEQMNQLNDMESFLTAAFGEYDPADWEDDEEEEQK